MMSHLLISKVTNPTNYEMTIRNFSRFEKTGVRFVIVRKCINSITNLLFFLQSVGYHHLGKLKQPGKLKHNFFLPLFPNLEKLSTWARHHIKLVSEGSCQISLEILNTNLIKQMNWHLEILSYTIFYIIELLL